VRGAFASTESALAITAPHVAATFERPLSYFVDYPFAGKENPELKGAEAKLHEILRQLRLEEIRPVRHAKLVLDLWRRS